MALVLKTDGTIQKIKLPSNHKKRLTFLQKCVGGYIEIVHRKENKVYLGNDEDRILQLPINPFLNGHFYGDLVCVQTPEEFS